MTTDPTVSQSQSLPRVTLVLGGARSGKSAYAESLIAACGTPAIYIATAQARDAEMTARIAAHQRRRSGQWRTIETQTDLVGGLSDAPPGTPILVDCLTLWLSNLMEIDTDIDAESARLETCLKSLSGPVVFVSNEVGLGIVPDNALARRFRDHAGHLNQTVARLADQVLFVAAGLPMRLK